MAAFSRKVYIFFSVNFSHGNFLNGNYFAGIWLFYLKFDIFVNLIYSLTNYSSYIFLIKFHLWRIYKMKYANKFLILMLLSVPASSFAMREEQIELTEGTNEQVVQVERDEQIEQPGQEGQILSAIVGGENNNLQEDASEDAETFEDVYNAGNLFNLLYFCSDLIEKKAILTFSEKILLNKLFDGKYSLFNECVEFIFGKYMENNKKDGSVRSLRYYIKNVVSWFIDNDFDITLKDAFGRNAIDALRLLQKKVNIALDSTKTSIEVFKKEIKPYEKRFKKNEITFFCGKMKGYKVLDTIIAGGHNLSIQDVIMAGRQPFVFNNFERDCMIENPVRICEFSLKSIERFPMPQFPANGNFSQKFDHKIVTIMISLFKAFLKFADCLNKGNKVYLDLCVQIGKRDRLEMLNRYIDRQIDKLKVHGTKKSMQFKMFDENKRKFSDVRIVAQD